jgi:hypothetical protein
MTNSGATVGCLLAFITTRFSACGPKSNPSPRATSSGFCWHGSRFQTTRDWRDRTHCRRCSPPLRGSRGQRMHGRPRFSRPELPSTSHRGWTRSVCPGSVPGRDSFPPRGGSGRAQPTTPVRATPITLLERRRAPLWLSLVGPSSGMRPSPQAQTVLDRLATDGALFFDELTDCSHMLRTQLEEALAELVALGLVNSDSFGGLRALLVPSAQRRPVGAAKRRGRVLSFGMESAGRWSLIRRINEPDTAAGVEHVARTLLRRYGVVFWRLLAREASCLPPWRDLLRGISPTRGTRRDSRRPICSRILRRALCAAGSCRSS